MTGRRCEKFRMYDSTRCFVALPIFIQGEDFWSTPRPFSVIARNTSLLE